LGLLALSPEETGIIPKRVGLFKGLPKAKKRLPGSATRGNFNKGIQNEG